MVITEPSPYGGRVLNSVIIGFGSTFLSVWLLKGFIDEIPVAYDAAALIDGYTRFQAF